MTKNVASHITKHQILQRFKDFPVMENLLTLPTDAGDLFHKSKIFNIK